MRRLLAASALLMLFSATPGMAEDYPWCVGEPNQGSLQCRFSSFEQCQGTAMGMGECYRNPKFTNSQTPSTGNSTPPVTVNNSRKKPS
jgi:Protein of unknown function (DUF3551)